MFGKGQNSLSKLPVASEGCLLLLGSAGARDVCEVGFFYISKVVFYFILMLNISLASATVGTELYRYIKMKTIFFFISDVEFPGPF